MTRRNVGIFIYDDMETLDFAGPFEVFSITGQKDEKSPGHFNVFLVAEEERPIIAVNGLSVNPHYTMKNTPPIDVLILPGGVGARKVIMKGTILEWVKEVNDKAELVLSVCTGSFILGKIGLLEGLKATTHHLCIDFLKELAPNADICSEERFLDNGKILTAAGISAGIDMSLYVVERLCGKEVALRTARYMEYPYKA
ncbi:MAG: DJ-1/PfpI family protein [Clostridiaceae bacterium]|nr:DJ-1/PfpI family protein [Clostridiaceae bacterium]